MRGDLHTQHQQQAVLHVATPSTSSVASAYKIIQNQSVHSSSTNVKLGDLSVVGREIINSSVKPAPKPGGALRASTVDSSSSHQQQQQEPADATPLAAAEPKSKFKGQTAAGLPIDQTNGLVFGFLDEDTVEALNENNQWKDRTNAMEKIEAQLM